MSEPQDKPFDIPKQMVWEAYKRVKDSKGAAGVDRQSLEEFESDLRNNLYKIWLCRVEDYAEWAVLGADPSSSGGQGRVSDSA